MAIELITITGTIVSASGDGVANAVVRLSPQPLSIDSPVVQQATGVVLDPIEELTDADGEFEITAIRGFSYLLEIPSIGLSETFVAPDLTTITFDLLGLVPVIGSAKDYVDDAGDPHVIVSVSVSRIMTVLQRFNVLVVESATTLTGPWTAITGSPVNLLADQDAYEINDDAPDVYYRAYYAQQFDDSIAGDVAGPLTVAGILTTDTLRLVTADDADITDECTITAADTIDNTGGTDTTGQTVAVFWLRDQSMASDTVVGSLFQESLVISIDEFLQVYLFGLDLTGDDGKPYPKLMYEWYIKAATKWLEHYLDIKIVAEDVVDEVQDHYATDYGRWGYFQLTNYPVSRIDGVRFKYPSMTDSVEINLNWIVLEDGGSHGVIQIVPGQGNIADVLLIPGALMPMWSGALGRVPGVWHFDYRTGFEVDDIPFDIKHVVGMVASLGVMNVAGDLVGGSGLQGWSVGLPGLSQSVTTTNSSTNAGFGARVLQYKQDVKQMLPTLRDFYGKRIKLVVG